MEFKNLDLFGGKFSIKITEKKTNYKTICGAIFTIFCIGVTGIAFYSFVTNYNDTKNPKVTIEKEISNQYPEIDLLENEFFPVLSFMNATNMIPASNLENMTTIIITKQIFGVNPNNINEITLTIVGKMKFVDCRKSRIDKNLMKKLIGKGNADIYYSLGYVLCPEHFDDPDFWKIKGSGTDIPFEYLSVKFFPCSFENDEYCFPLEKFMLTDIYMSTISKTYDLKNKEIPETLLYEADRVMFGFDPGINQQIHLKFKNIQILNEDKDFLKAEQISSFYSIEDTFSYLKKRDGSIYCTKEQIDNFLCLPYTEVNIRSGPKVETVLRVYPKLFSMISELGGFGDLTFIIVGFIYLFYNSFFFEKWLHEKLFTEVEKKSLLKWIKKEIDEKVSEDKIEAEKRKLMDESRNGVMLMKTLTMMKTISEYSISEEHRKVLENLPIMIKIQNRDKEDKKEEKSLEKCIEEVLQKNPKTEFEKLIRNKLIEASNNSMNLRTAKIFESELGEADENERKNIFVDKRNSKNKILPLKFSGPSRELQKKKSQRKSLISSQNKYRMKGRFLTVLDE